LPGACEAQRSGACAKPQVTRGFLRERPVVQAQAWRISFLAAAPAQQPPLAVIKEPSNVVAVAAPVELTEALSLAAGPAGGSLLVIWAPSSAGGSVDLDSNLHAWIRRDLAANQSPVHASINPEHLSDTMDAVARFTLAARQTAALEARMAAAWPQIEAHTPLTHAVTRQQQRLQPQVNALTEQATEMKAMHLRPQTALEQIDPTLSGTSKRMYADLAEAAALHDRVEMLEDPIQFAPDHYESANWRLTEIGAARRGQVLEVLIVIILFAGFRHAASRCAASAAARDFLDRDPVGGPGPEGPGPLRAAFSGRCLPAVQRICLECPPAARPASGISPSLHVE
jgi:hypothetical protein